MWGKKKSEDEAKAVGFLDRDEKDSSYGSVEHAGREGFGRNTRRSVLAVFSFRQ